MNWVVVIFGPGYHILSQSKKAYCRPGLFHFFYINEGSLNDCTVKYSLNWEACIWHHQDCPEAPPKLVDKDRKNSQGAARFVDRDWEK